MRNANSDNKGNRRRSERQTREAGKFPYHRYDKLMQEEDRLAEEVKGRNKPNI